MVTREVPHKTNGSVANEEMADVRDENATEAFENYLHHRLAYTCAHLHTHKHARAHTIRCDSANL